MMETVGNFCLTYRLFFMEVWLGPTKTAILRGCGGGNFRFILDETVHWEECI